MLILCTYFDHKTEPFPTFSPYPKIYDLVWQVSNISLSPVWMNYHPDFVPYHDFEVSMSLHLNPPNKSMGFHSFCKIPLLSNRQIWFPTTWNFLIRTVTFLALWYSGWNNGTNRTNLHLFGTTLLVSPIYTQEFLIYPFWAYLNLCIVYIITHLNLMPQLLHRVHLICVLFILILIIKVRNLFQAFHLTQNPCNGSVRIQHIHISSFLMN